MLMNHLSSRKIRARGRGFAIIEMLVVIGVIGVLVAILLPTVSAMKRRAELTRCASNLRQIGNAFLLRAHDTSGYLPLCGEVVIPGNTIGLNTLPAALQDSGRKRYAYVKNDNVPTLELPAPLPVPLASYLGIKTVAEGDQISMSAALNAHREELQIFMCPSLVETEREDSGASCRLTLEGVWSFVWITTPGTIDYAANEGITGYHYSPRYSNRRLNGHLSRLKDVANVLLMSDASHRGGWLYWTPALDGQGSCTLADALVDNGRAEGSARFDQRRHRGQLNVLFADGHVETLAITSKALDRVLLLPR
jgi:prepilin-type processing-associated H-X9-DG protein/prepilin-type N-terminal cleavage/methylation domain-containing protein